MSHLDQRLAQNLHHPHDGAVAERTCALCDLRDARGGQLDEFRREHGKERVAHGPHDVLGEGARVTTELHRVRDRSENASLVLRDECVDDLVGGVDRLELRAAGDHEFERRESVARASAALAKDEVDGLVVNGEPGLLDDEAHVLVEFVDGEKVELQVLHAAADGLGHLLRVRCRQHENDVFRRFLEGLQQGGLGTLGEHVHFVEDEDAVTTRTGESGGLDEVADLLHTVVAGCVEFEDVVAVAEFDRLAAVTRAARFSVLR